MIEVLQKLILSLTRGGANRRLTKQVRRLAAAMIVSREKLPDHIEAIAELWEQHAQETAKWIGPDAIVRGESGHFDACDLRHWLALAERTGVPAVPARVILELTEDEMSVASGRFQIPDSIRRRVAALVGDTDAPPAPILPDPEIVEEKLAAAMDDVPDGWMVRLVRCGPESLKALAGCGIAGPDAPEVRFSSDLEVGPGWFRIGNRRSVDSRDERITRGAAEGPVGPVVFVARPWVKASRWAVCDDPHRHGTKLAGKGMWPCEWRAFAERGRVVGVSFYYAWAGQPSPENARMALSVRELAQRVVDEATRLQAYPLLMDIEFARGRDAQLSERFPRDAVSCTLDFIETADGLQLLEGGPPNANGGGHPCGFAGLDNTEGVAFRVRDGVLLGGLKTWADPRKWVSHDDTGAVWPWDAVERLAKDPQPQI